MAASRWPLHPLLVSVYFVLTLAASNAAALKGARDLAGPLGIAVLVCGVCWALAWAVTRDAHKASLLSLLWVVGFSTFGYVSEILLPETFKIAGGGPGLVGLFTLALIGPSLAIRRTGRDLAPLNRYITLVAVLLVAYTTVRLYQGLRQERDLSALLPPPAVRSGHPPPAELPDIYLVVLDKYTGGEVLAERFGFDNGAFEASLRARGFIVPSRARANYPQTQLALAAMLNLDYVQSLPRQIHLNDLVEHNRLAVFLQRRGYRFVFLPSAFKVTSQNRNADLQLPPPAQIRGEFGSVWKRTTVLPELLASACALLECKTGRLRYVPEAADFMDWKFERLQELAGGERPTFVLAHLSLPHEPFLYEADCTHREPYWPAGAGMPGDEKADLGYLSQIGCTNLKVAALADSILARSSRPAVILLQADHGHGRLGRHLPEYQDVDPERLRERMSVFAAYLLPGVDPDSISDTITPVSALRFVLRHYFGADLPPTEDASYWSTEARPLELVRIDW